MAAADSDIHQSLSRSSPCENSGNASRPTPADYHPSVWRDYFITQELPSSNIKSPQSWVKQRVDVLIKEVEVLLKTTENHLQEMELIDALQRLGVAYHFEDQIDEILKVIHGENDTSIDDLHYVALRFRLLRQHGYYVPSDAFNQFLDDEGRFKATLRNDAKGLLSLYEAAYLSVPGEDILDDAINFTKKHLESIESNLVSHALHTPLRRRMPRLEARNYIDIYQEDEENRNDIVLELAKLDFHLLQLLHLEEVKSICMWSKELGLAEKLTFARDRVVECYFWILGVYFEPKYSRARIMMTKVINHFSFMDDIYDDYGTVEELRIYTAMIQRWDLVGVDQLNELLRLQYLALYDTVKEFEDELAIDQISYRVQYLKEATKKTCRAWFAEAQWRDEEYVPSFKEYLSIALESNTYPTLSCVSFVGMGKEATRQAFDWILSCPKFVQAASTICRLRDDIVSKEIEQRRKHVATATQCCMKENGGSEEEACVRLLEMVENAWKELNEEFLKESREVSMHLLMRIVNLARIMETMYKDFDAYTHSKTVLKDYITELLVRPILL